MIDICSIIDITWTVPTVDDDRVPIQYYILRLYDAITGSLVDTVSVYDTSYQFVDNNLLDSPTLVGLAHACVGDY